MPAGEDPAAACHGIRPWRRLGSAVHPDLGHRRAGRLALGGTIRATGDATVTRCRYDGRGPRLGAGG